MLFYLVISNYQYFSIFVFYQEHVAIENNIGIVFVSVFRKLA